MELRDATWRDIACEMARRANISTTIVGNHKPGCDAEEESTILASDPSKPAGAIIIAMLSPHEQDVEGVPRMVMQPSLSMFGSFKFLEALFDVIGETATVAANKLVALRPTAEENSLLDALENQFKTPPKDTKP